MKLLRTLLLTALAVFATNAFGQPVIVLEHDSAWDVQRGQATIRVLQIANVGNEESGPLYLSVYARSGTGWAGSGSPGALVTRLPIESIPANSTANNIVATGKGRMLPSGEKYTALLVERKNGRRYEMLDYVIYTSTYTFPRGQSGGVGSDDSSIGTGDVVFRGDVTLTGRGRVAEFSINQIQNQRHDNESGPLRLAIYASAEPYAPGAEHVVVATRPLGRLAQGDFFNQLRGRLNMKRPGRGAFYLTLVVEEDLGSGFQPVAFVGTPEPREF